jgi:hypothetical protein
MQRWERDEWKADGDAGGPGVWLGGVWGGGGGGGGPPPRACDGRDGPAMAMMASVHVHVLAMAIGAMALALVLSRVAEEP